MAMNNRLLFRTLAIAALIMVGALAIGVGAYNAGWTHGVAESGRVMAAAPAGPPYVYMWPHPWGFGFPFFPMLFFLVFFFFVRGLLWRGRWHGGWGPRYDSVPPAFEEWHRRAHAGQSDPRPREPGAGARQ